MHRVTPDVTEEDLPGGVVKTRRTKRRPDKEEERRGKNKSPRRMEKALFQEQMFHSEKAVEPPEERKMNAGNNHHESAPVMPRFEICPSCGFFNKPADQVKDGKPVRYIVCKGCDDKYRAYGRKVAEDLAAGRKPKVLTKLEWVLSQLDLERFEREWQRALRDRENPKPRIDEKVLARTGGADLPEEVIEPLRQNIAAEIKKDDYFLVKRLNFRLQAARKLKPELEQMIAEAQKKAAEPVAETPTATTEVPTAPTTIAQTEPAPPTEPVLAS